LPKNVAKILEFLTQTSASFWQHLTITLALEKNANFFAENWQKSPKIGKNSRKLAKIAENWKKSPKIGKNRQKL
jgi:hypothetical protein